MERWKRLPDSELEVMLIIWDGKEKVSTSDIMQHLKEKSAAGAKCAQSSGRKRICSMRKDWASQSLHTTCVAGRISGKRNLFLSGKDVPEFGKQAVCRFD